jgi:glycosyltransferase involved in cell wall biosynthesis
MNASVSIIVPCYNLSQYLAETLDSVSEQTYMNWECIIINDGSIDNTEEIALAYLEKDNRFKYIFQENQGVSSARNNGIKLSSGLYILPLDADDLIAPNYIKEAVEILEKDNDIKIVYSNFKNFGGDYGIEIPKFTMKKLLLENMIFCSAIFRRIDFDAVGGYNEKMVYGIEDWDLWLSLMSHGGKVYKIPKVYFFYRIRESSRQRSISEDKYKLLKNQLYLNHQELYFQFFNNPIDLYKKYYNVRNFYFRKSLNFFLRKYKIIKHFVITVKRVIGDYDGM